MAGAAGALLAIDLDAAAAHLGAGEPALRALALVGEIGPDDLVHGGHVDLDAETFSLSSTSPTFLPAILCNATLGMFVLLSLGLT